MNSKLISVAEDKTTIPEVMFGDIPIVIYEQDLNIDGCGNVQHRHSEAQLSLVLSGRVKFVFQDMERTLEEGQSIFINCNRLHCAVPCSDGGCRYLCIKFNPAAIGGGAGGCLFSQYVEPLISVSAAEAVSFTDDEPARCVRELLSELVSTYVDRPSAYELRINILLSQLWLKIYEQSSLESSSFRNASFLEKQRIDRLCEYIHNNYAEKISLSDIANSAHISRGECCRIFKRLFHTTPFQYLVYYRLTRSIQLLTETDYSISQIAQQVGFCSSSYYTKCFRKEYNCVPHKYRQDLHKLPGAAAHDRNA